MNGEMRWRCAKAGGLFHDSLQEDLIPMFVVKSYTCAGVYTKTALCVAAWAFVMPFRTASSRVFMLSSCHTASQRLCQPSFVYG